MQLRVVCRSYGGENMKSRPAYYSKLLALQSLVRAADESGADVVYLNDGPIPEDRLSLMRTTGEVVALDWAGMRASYRAALRLPIQRGWDGSDVVLFAEDDYLYLPDSLSHLLLAAQTLPADYFALYAGTREHPVGGVTGTASLPVPRGWHEAGPVRVADQEWVRVQSTTSTFAARVAALREDMSIFRQGMLPHRRSLRDHDTCLVLQGCEPHRWSDLLRDIAGVGDAHGDETRWQRLGLIPFKAALNIRAHRRPSRRRSLMAPSPNVATHLEIPWVAGGRNWEAVAEEVASWYATAASTPDFGSGEGVGACAHRSTGIDE